MRLVHRAGRQVHVTRIRADAGRGLTNLWFFVGDADARVEAGGEGRDARSGRGKLGEGEGGDEEEEGEEHFETGSW